MFPDDGILSEESKDDLSRLTKERVWIVDPLDGTKEFIARNGEFSIMIGLAIGGRPKLGVIMHPGSGQLYVGAVGMGAYLYEDGERIPLSVSHCTELSDMVMVSSRSHRQQIVDRMRATLRITRERVSGSVGLKVGLIVRRLSDVYIHPSPGCKEWDLCAPQALLEAAGGVMTDCWGNRLRYNQRGRARPQRPRRHQRPPARQNRRHRRRHLRGFRLQPGRWLLVEPGDSHV